MTLPRSRARSALAAVAFAAAAALQGGCSCQNPATQLAFSVQPGSTTAGTALSVRVQAQDRDGRPALDFSGEVNLSIGSGPPGAVMEGTAAVAARRSLAAFDGLTFNRVGEYRLRATSPGVAEVTSEPFIIEPGPEDSLAFAIQPSNVAINRRFAPVVQVVIRDFYGNLTRSALPVQLRLSVNPGGATLRGATTVTAADGTATFTDLAVGAVGNGYQLEATSDGLLPATSNAFNVTIPQLSYTNPTAPAKVRLVRDDAASTNEAVVLRLEAAAVITGYSIGLDLPVDPTKVEGLVFTPGTAFPPGQPPSVPVYGARIATSGPLAGVLVSGQSQRPTGSGAIATNTTVLPGAVFYTLRLDLSQTAGFGLVFDGANPGLKFRAAVRDRQGTEVVAASEFAVGRLEVR